MSLSIEQALAELRELSTRLESLPPDHPDRAPLEERRQALREAAQAAADLARSPVALERELDMLRERLRRIEGMRIKRSLMERRRWVNDPSAYARGINERIASGNAEDRSAIEERISVLETRLAEHGGQPGSGSSPSERSASNE